MRGVIVCNIQSGLTATRSQSRGYGLAPLMPPLNNPLPHNTPTFTPVTLPQCADFKKLHEQRVNVNKFVCG